LGIDASARVGAGGAVLMMVPSIPPEMH